MGAVCRATRTEAALRHEPKRPTSSSFHDVGLMIGALATKVAYSPGYGYGDSLVEGDSKGTTKVGW